MPTISQFFGIVIQMFWREHAPPHFHALYAEHKALIDIRTLEVVGGSLPRRALSLHFGMGQRTPRRIAGGLDTMPNQADAVADRATGVIAAAPWRVKTLNVLPDYRLAVTFQDGTSGIADFSALTTAAECGMYQALKDPTVFRQARLELWAVTRPNGADMDPAWMYEQVKAEKTWSVPF